jgi:hypothetical protein
MTILPPVMVERRVARIVALIEPPAGGKWMLPHATPA